MVFIELAEEEKQRLFEFIAQLAIMAGEEMSREGFAAYNDVVMGFLNNAELLDDFMAVAAKAKLRPEVLHGGEC